MGVGNWKRTFEFPPTHTQKEVSHHRKLRGEGPGPQQPQNPLLKSAELLAIRGSPPPRLGEGPLASFPGAAFLVATGAVGVPSHSVVSDSLQPHRLQPIRLLCPWDSPDKNIEVGCHSILQGIFPTQGSNPGLPHCRQVLYCLSHQEWICYTHRSPMVTGVGRGTQ